MTSFARKMARKHEAIARAQREHEARLAARPRWRRWLSAAWSWFFRQLGPGRQRFLVRFLVIWNRYWTNPAVPIEKLGRVGRHEYRPAEIELAFQLFADGSVLYRNRWGNDEWVTDEHLIGVVHREYRELTNAARKHFAELNGK